MAGGVGFRGALPNPACVFRVPFALDVIAAVVLATQPSPARAADPAIVTCLVRIRSVVGLPSGVAAIEFSSWNATPLNARATLYTATRSFTLDLHDVPFEAAAADAKATAPFRTAPLYFRMPTKEPLEAAKLDFAPGGAACLTSGYIAAPAASANATPSPHASALAERFERDKPPVLDAVFRSDEPPDTCAVPYRAARSNGQKHVGVSAAVPYEAGIVYIAVGLTEKGDVSSIGLLSSSVSRPFEGAALARARDTLFDPEIFRCRAVPTGYVYRFQYREHDAPR